MKEYIIVKLEDAENNGKLQPILFFPASYMEQQTGHLEAYTHAEGHVLATRAYMHTLPDASPEEAQKALASYQAYVRTLPQMEDYVCVLFNEMEAG